MSVPHEVHVSPHPGWDIVQGGYTVLVTRPDGSFDARGREGLYDFDTRILSRHRLTINGERPFCVGSELVEAGLWRAHLLAPRRGGNARGPLLPQDVVAVTISRHVCRGMLEELVVRNHSMAPVELELAVELDADFADVQEVDGHPRHHGKVVRHWNPESCALRLDYRAEHDSRRLERGLRVRVLGRNEVRCGAGVLRFRVALAPGAHWRARLAFDSFVDGAWRKVTRGEVARRTTLRRHWQARRAAFEASSPLAGVIERAAEDLLALRNWEYDVADDAWVPNAGVPTYTGLFGRDILTAGWQAAVLSPELMRGAIARLAASQATADCAWRDEEPGKFPHEMRRGPLSDLDIIPQRAYFGEQTATAMFVITLSEYWHWTGDTGMLERYRDATLRAMAWADRYGDRDGDGLLEYVKRSPLGLKNQGWKDSDEAIRYADGRLVEDPIATIEEQAYHFLALQRTAELLFALRDERGAERFLNRARALERTVNRAFWLEDQRFYAVALDPDKCPVTTIASNPGHALATGIVPVERAADVARRLLAPDMFSGWGVRTLSSAHPAFNPYAYHLGTVWPVENATFALGFKRYGLDDEAERVVAGMFQAAAHFEALRLPEALGGQARETVPIPTFYPQSNSPQAWSAGAIVLLVQAMLGLYPFAPANLLALVRPRLPAWLPDLTVRRLRVGDATVSLRFTRRGNGSTEHEVLERTGNLHILSVPPPAHLASGRESLLEHLKSWAVRHAPGRTAQLLRIALGLAV